MSDRLADLQRQRALAQEQVAWLDREIAKETGLPSATLPAPTAPAAVTPTGTDTAGSTADDIIAQYSRSGGNTEKEVKRGCYLYFALTMGAVMLFAAGVYFIYSRK